MKSTQLEQESKEIINDIHALNERFFDQIKFTYLESKDEILFIPSILNDAYSEEEPEYNSLDLIWKNPKYDPTR